MSGVPVELLDLRAAVREWCQLDVNDPRATDAILNSYIIAAFCRFTVANPVGWSWDKAYTATSTPWQVTAASGGDFFYHYGADPNLAASPGQFWTRIRTIELVDSNGQTRIPLERLTRAEQLCRFPRDSEKRTPRTWSLTGFRNGAFPGTGDLVVARFRPKPDVNYTARVYGTLPLGPLVADNDPDGAAGVRDNQIAQWSDCIVAYAAFLVLRARGDLAEAYLGAKQYFDEQVMALRKTNRIRVGAGRGNNPIADQAGEML